MGIMRVKPKIIEVRVPGRVTRDTGISAATIRVSRGTVKRRDRKLLGELVFHNFLGRERRVATDVQAVVRAEVVRGITPRSGGVAETVYSEKVPLKTNEASVPGAGRRVRDHEREARAAIEEAFKGGRPSGKERA